jgi:hypothetical protein
LRFYLRRYNSTISVFHKIFCISVDLTPYPLNNSRFGDFVVHIYPIKLEIKDTTDTDRSASYLDLHLEIDSEGWLRMKL